MAGWPLFFTIHPPPHNRVAFMSLVLYTMIFFYAHLIFVTMAIGHFTANIYPYHC